jgi:hypothetical protein
MLDLREGGKRAVKIEAGQIWNPDSFPPPNELVCVQVSKVFDQVALRDCVTRSITLTAGDGVDDPVFSYEGVDGFEISDVRVVSKTDSPSKPGYKRLKLNVKIKYTVHYSDGENESTKDDEASFYLTINEIYCPSCLAQIGVIHYPQDQQAADGNEAMLKVDALAEAFNDALDTATGLLSLDIGAFFVVRCECVVQLLIPSYGYCPMPPEQPNAASQTCTTFNDRTITPFPTTFFPDQKWNPLDKNE